MKEHQHYPVDTPIVNQCLQQPNDGADREDITSCARKLERKLAAANKEIERLRQPQKKWTAVELAKIGYGSILNWEALTNAEQNTLLRISNAINERMS